MEKDGGSVAQARVCSRGNHSKLEAERRGFAMRRYLPTGTYFEVCPAIKVYCVKIYTTHVHSPVTQCPNPRKCQGL